jgi:hypothetical protein
MRVFVLAIDQGTTNTKALALAADGHIVARRKSRECRAFLWRRKSCLDARTTWRWRQTRETGLRDGQIPVDREKNREFCAFAPFSHDRAAENVPLLLMLIRRFPMDENREFSVNQTGICER